MRLWSYVALLVLVAIPIAGASTVAEEEFTCPIGGQKFKATIAMSGSQFGQNLDLRPIGAIISPWPVPKCPKNGFVLFKDDAFSSDELKALEPFVMSDRYQAAQKIESDYYLVALLERQLKMPASEIAYSLLRATWEVTADDRYPRYAQEALDAFDGLLADASSRVDRKMRQNYAAVSGELERRLGKFGKAKARFLALLAEDGVKGNVMETIAREELALIAAGDTATHAIDDGKKK